MDGFSARIKPEPKDVEEEEEEGIGDVDLFALDKESEVLTVNSKWLYHLQVPLKRHALDLTLGECSSLTPECCRCV